MIAHNLEEQCQIAFATARKHLRVLRWASVGSLLLAVPVSFVVMLIGHRIAGSSEIGFVAGGFFVGVYVTFAVLLAFFHCPQCGGRFAENGALWKRKCARCGFEV